MPYNFAADSFHKRNFVADFLQAKCDFRRKSADLRFSSGTVRWYLRLRFFFRFITIHAFDKRTDRQTDGRTVFSSLDRVCIPCSALKKKHKIWTFEVFVFFLEKKTKKNYFKTHFYSDAQNTSRLSYLTSRLKTLVNGKKHLWSSPSD